MASTRKAADRAVTDAGQALKQQARFSTATLRRFGGRLLIVFVGLLLPMWGFAELAEDIHEQESIPFDEPILRFAHHLARDGFDNFFVLISKLGFAYGVVPFDVLFVVLLTLLRRYRESTFAALALGGSALLNMAAKDGFARARPSLWESISPESTFSFPSGHAMGSATLACVLILLAWPTRWRWPLAVVAIAFTIAVGLSRIYLGVHYPSDILGGWTAAVVWTVACYFLVYGNGLQPWSTISKIAPVAAK
jgi:undecaprenyl-diphosphatase